MIFDFLFFLIISLWVILGYKKGFSSMFISLIGFGISIVLSLSLYSWFGNIFLQSDTGTQIKNNLSTDIRTSLGSESKIIENVPYLSSISGVVSDDEGVIDFNILAESIAKKATKSIIIIPLIILTVVAAHISTFIFNRFFSKLTKLPLVHGLDSALGSVCGLLTSVLIIGTIFVFMVFLQFVPALSFMQEQFNQSNIVLLINDFIL